jgi:hypothetical protein
MSVLVIIIELGLFIGEILIKFWANCPHNII